MTVEGYTETRTARLQRELDLDAVGAFEVRWYRPDRTAGPFGTKAELLDYMRTHGLGRPDELFVPFDSPGPEAA